jgi:hypothetical protein
MRGQNTTQHTASPPYVVSLCSCSRADEGLGIYKVELIWQY